MKLPRLLALVSFLFLAFIPACNTTESMEASTPVPTLHPTETGEVVPTTLPTISKTESKNAIDNDSILIEKAKNDLAQRLDIVVNQIYVVETSEVTWPDTSLGCPQEGMVYAEVVTDGFLIKLEAETQIYEYHTNGTQSGVLCENTSLSPYPMLTPNPKEMKDRTPWMPVD